MRPAVDSMVVQHNSNNLWTWGTNVYIELVYGSYQPKNTSGLARLVNMFHLGYISKLGNQHRHGLIRQFSKNIEHFSHCFAQAIPHG